MSTTPCLDCGLRPAELHYRHRTNQVFRRGRCHACAQRWYRAQQGARWATLKYIVEQAS